MGKVETISFKRRKLPHWDVFNKSYFITFRLRGSLPKDVVVRLKNEKELIKAKQNNKEELYQFHRKEFLKIEKVLDSVKNSENAYLTRDDIAPILMNSLSFLEDKYCWRIPHFVIMPNHIHCLCLDDKPGKRIDKTGLFSEFKRYTAVKINKIFNRKGRVWNDENFEHWCRDYHKEESVKRYILNNPVKAGFVKSPTDWKWQWSK